MAKRRKFNKIKTVKEMARERVGAPRPKQVIPDKRDQEKYRPDYTAQE